jgi:hypothetical protein
VCAARLNLSWEETGCLYEGIVFGSRTLRGALRIITDEYGLGQRGAWILVLISSGQVFPSELTDVFRVGRSLMTTELAPSPRPYRKSTSDRRRVKLALTPLGEKVSRQVVLRRPAIDKISTHPRKARRQGGGVLILTAAT